MGSMLTKNSPGLVVWRNQSVEQGRNRESRRRRTGGASSDKTQAAMNTHDVEADGCQITQNKNDDHGMVPSNVTGPQKTSTEGVETQSLLGSSGSTKVVSGILVAETAVEAADPVGDITVSTEAQPTELDLPCEDEAPSEESKTHVVAGQDFGGSPETSKEASVLEPPPRSSMVSEEDIPPKIPHIVNPVAQEGTSWKAVEDLHSPLNVPDEEEPTAEPPLRSSMVSEEDIPPKVPHIVSPVVQEGASWKAVEELHSNAPDEDEPTADDQKVSGEMDFELGPEKAVGAAEHDPIVQRQVHDASSGEAPGMAETHPSSPTADT